MAFLTDRKRAVGLGAAKTGTEHLWSMTVSSAALLVLVPLFVFTFGAVLGSDYDTVMAYYSRPFPAIVAILTLGVGFHHFAMGARTMIEDYVHGLARKVAIIAVTCVSYTAIAAALFAIARIAL